jgi:MFS family permease
MRRTAIFFGTMGFAINISAPFQVPYMLNTLHVGYLHLSFVSAAYIGARFFTAPTIGKLIDSLGSKHLLLFSTLLMPWISLGWALSPTYSCILITQFFAGLVWTTFDLCAFTYLTESTTSEKRQRAFSLKHISWYLGSSSGAILGGIIESTFFNPQTVFWASSFFRGVAALFIFRMVGKVFVRKKDNTLSEDLPTIRDVA